MCPVICHKFATMGNILYLQTAQSVLFASSNLEENPSQHPEREPKSCVAIRWLSRENRGGGAEWSEGIAGFAPVAAKKLRQPLAWKTGTALRNGLTNLAVHDIYRDEDTTLNGELPVVVKWRPAGHNWPLFGAERARLCFALCCSGPKMVCYPSGPRPGSALRHAKSSARGRGEPASERRPPGFPGHAGSQAALGRATALPAARLQHPC